MHNEEQEAYSYLIHDFNDLKKENKRLKSLNSKLVEALEEVRKDLIYPKTSIKDLPKVVVSINEVLKLTKEG